MSVSTTEPPSALMHCRNDRSRPWGSHASCGATLARDKSTVSAAWSPRDSPSVRQWCSSISLHSRPWRESDGRVSTPASRASTDHDRRVATRSSGVILQGTNPAAQSGSHRCEGATPHRTGSRSSMRVGGKASGPTTAAPPVTYQPVKAMHADATITSPGKVPRLAESAAAEACPRSISADVALIS